MLTEAEVKALLEKSQLPGAARRKLATAQYADAAAVQTAITAEAAYLKEVEVADEDLAALKDLADKLQAGLAAVSAPAAPAPAETPAADDGGMPAAEVAAELARSGLPAASQTRLAEAMYADAAALKNKIVAERDYLKNATGSGRPVNRRTPEVPATRQLAERNATADAVVAQGFGIRRPARAQK